MYYGFSLPKAELLFTIYLNTSILEFTKWSYKHFNTYSCKSYYVVKQNYIENYLHDFVILLILTAKFAKK